MGVAVRVGLRLRTEGSQVDVDSSVSVLLLLVLLPHDLVDGGVREGEEVGSEGGGRGGD